MGLIKFFKIHKRKKILKEGLQDLINLMIVLDNPKKQDLYTKKTAANTTLSYAASYQRLLNKCIEFKEVEKKEIELSALYSLFYAISCFYGDKYREALSNLKEVLNLITLIEKDFETEAKYLYYLTTIFLTNVVGQEAFEVLEKKMDEEKVVQKDIYEKILKAEGLLNDFNSDKYKSLGQNKIEESKLRILENQKKLYIEFLDIEKEISGENLPIDFLDVLDGLNESLDSIKEEMLKNGFLLIETNNENKFIYPTEHFSDLIYLYLQNQRAKNLFYKKDFEQLKILISDVFHQTNYSNWEQPLLVLKNGNKEDTLTKIQPNNKLFSYNNYIDTLVFEKNEDNSVLFIRNKNEDEEIQCFVKKLSVK